MLRILRLACALMLGFSVFACKSAGNEGAGRERAPRAGDAAAGGGIQSAGSAGAGQAKAGAEGTAGPQAGGGGFAKNRAGSGGNTGAQAGQGAMPWPRAHVLFQLKAGQ
jgi:hypothetical protein